MDQQHSTRHLSAVLCSSVSGIPRRSAARSAAVGVSMNKEMIISSGAHDTRVAILEDDQVVEIFIERENQRGVVGNIYKGRVSKVLPGMQSSFIDIGLERDAFLYVTEVINTVEEFEKPRRRRRRRRRGQEGARRRPAARPRRRGRPGRGGRRRCSPTMRPVRGQSPAGPGGRSPTAGSRAGDRRGRDATGIAISPRPRSRTC